MAEAFRLEEKGWNDSFLPLDDELMPESVSRPVIASSSARTCDRNQRRTVGQKALSLSLKVKGKPVERFQFVDSAMLSARSLYRRIPGGSGRSLLSCCGAKGELHASRRNPRI